MNRPGYIITNETITLLIEGENIMLRKGTLQFAAVHAAVLAALQTDDWAKVVTAATNRSLGLQALVGVDWCVVDDRTIQYKNKPIPDAIRHRLVRLVTVGEDVQPLVNFYERLARNPSWNSVQQLFNFLDHLHIPLLEDGCFLAYKNVREDFKDQHSNTIDNSPGTVHAMDRNLVSDDPDLGCHFGFHVGTLDYAEGFAKGQLVICKIDPEHVVCVPRDHTHQKMRICRYEVIGLYAGTPLADDVHRVSPDEQAAKQDWEGDTEDEDDTDDVEEIPQAQRDRNVDVVIALNDAITKKKAKPRSKASQFRRMDAAKLMTQSLADLRGYASHSLKIVGAYRIPGGKATLVQRILRVHRKK